MEKNYYLENRTIHTIAGMILCLQGVCGISLVSTGTSSLGYLIDYYDYMFSSISIVLVGINIICGIVIMGAYVFTGVSALCRKKELLRFGIAACGVSYVLVVIRDIIGAAYYGISGTLFINILCLAVFAALTVAVLTNVAELRQIIVKYNTILWAVPAAIFILTLIVSSYYLTAGNVFFSIVETLAQIAAIYVTAAVIRWDASGSVPEADGWNQCNINMGEEQAAMNENVNCGAGSNAGNGADMNNAFNVNNSVQAPEGYRNVALVIVFSIITLGIYALYWVYKVSQLVNRELRTGKSETVQLLLFMFVPFYSWYWYYVMTENIGHLAAVKGRNKVSSIPAVNLVLAIFGFGIVAIALMQDDLNKIAGECECYAYQRGYAGYEQPGANGSSYQTPSDAVYEKAPAAEGNVIYAETEPASEPAPAPVHEEPETAEQPVSEPAVPEVKLPYEELKKLKELLDENIITQEEFEQLKKKFI